MLKAYVIWKEREKVLLEVGARCSMIQLVSLLFFLLIKNVIQSGWGDCCGGMNDCDVFYKCIEDMFLFNKKVDNRKTNVGDGTCNFFFIIGGIDEVVFNVICRELFSV